LKKSRPAARHRVQSRRDQAVEDFIDRNLPSLREVVDLRGSERLDLNIRVR
jgi:hypothetical protein